MFFAYHLVDYIVLVGSPFPTFLFPCPVPKGIITIPGLHLPVLLDFRKPAQCIIAISITAALLLKTSSLFCNVGLVSQKVIQIGITVKDAFFIAMCQFCQLVFSVVSIGGLCSIRELFFTQPAQRVIRIGDDAVPFF